MGVVLLVRHGQASFGSADYDRLSAIGRRQAYLLAVRLGERHAAPPPGRALQVVSGGLSRQRGTAAPIGAACGVPVQVDPRWDEYDHVAITADRAADLVVDPRDPGRGRHRAAAVLDDAVRQWVAGTSRGTESHAAFLRRCSQALETVTGNPGTTVVLTSGGVIAAICAAQLDLPTTRWPALARVLVNTGITTIVAGRQGVSLVTFNDHAHLEQDRELITYR